MQEITLDQVVASDYDVIIAGSGAGGLLTALALSHEGKRILILEKAARLGGVWYSYWVDSFRVDQGLHVITRVTHGAFVRLLKTYLSPPPKFVLHQGWHFRVNDKVGTIPSSIGETLRWPLTGWRGRLSLVRIGAKIKTMKLKEMQKYKDISFLEFMKSQGVTNQAILDVMQSAIYLAAGVPISEASAYEALRTLKDTDKESSKLASAKKLLFGSDDYDEGYVIGGMDGLIKRVIETINGDYVLNTPVEQIHEENGRVTGCSVAGKTLFHNRIVSNIPLWSMSDIVKSSNVEVVDFFERWSTMKPTHGITLWLGLSKEVIGDRKNRVIVHPLPNRWIVSISSFDPSCAPEGKELVAVAMMTIPGKSKEEMVEIMKGNGLEKYHPGILDHAEMEHVQMSYATRAALIPGQTDLDRPGPRTPIKGLYIVGTDTAGSGVGLQQAAQSADGVVKALHEDE
ncbi:MAG: phytoene desaturase family protein [Candidatus Thorarchaeota archaeon]